MASRFGLRWRFTRAGWHGVALPLRVAFTPLPRIARACRAIIIHVDYRCH